MKLAQLIDLDTREPRGWYAVKIQRIAADEGMKDEITRVEGEASSLDTYKQLKSMGKRTNLQAQEEKFDKYYIFQKLAKGVALDVYISTVMDELIEKKKSEQECYDDILSAATASMEEVVKFHQKKLIHNDLKPEHLIYNPSSGKVTLIDLGSAAKVKKRNDKAKCRNFTDGFSSPSMLSSGMSSQADDVYAMGRCFEGCLMRFREDFNTELIEELRDLISEMTSYHPTDRPLSEEVACRLNIIKLKNNFNNALNKNQDEKAKEIEKDLKQEQMKLYELNGQISAEKLRSAINEFCHYEVANEASINAVVRNGKTLLQIAIEGNNYEFVSILLSNGAKIDPENIDLPKLIRLALDNQSIKIVKILIDEGVNINAVNEDGKTLLMLAIEKGHTDFALKLINKYVNINAANNDGRTPLMLAIDNGNYAIASALIKKGADINAASINGRTPLMSAIQKNNNIIVSNLIDKDAIINTADKDGWTPLMMAIKKGNIKITQMLINKGADINVADKDGWTPLMVAIQKGNIKIAQMLINEGADINAVNNDGKTPLMIAEKSGKLDIAQMLIDKGAESNVTRKDDRILQQFSIEEEKPEIVQVLSDGSENLNTPNKDGIMPLMLAINQGDNETALVLIEKGANINAVDKYGWTPLLRAIKTGNNKIASVLIEKGADINAALNADEDSMTPLFMAMENGNYDMVSMLIKKGANIEDVNIDGMTPLITAIIGGDNKSALMLIENGANIDVKTEKGFTVLMIAIAQGNNKIASVLIEKGADINAVLNADDEDEVSTTPLMLAIDQAIDEDNTDIISIFIEKGKDTDVAKAIKFLNEDAYEQLGSLLLNDLRLHINSFHSESGHEGRISYISPNEFNTDWVNNICDVIQNAQMSVDDKIIAIQKISTENIQEVSMSKELKDKIDKISNIHTLRLDPQIESRLSF